MSKSRSHRFHRMDWHADAEELIQCARYGELEELAALLTVRGCFFFPPRSRVLSPPAQTHANNADFVNHRNEWGQSALQNASANGHTDIVTRLLAAGARASDPNPEGNTALHWACLMGHVDVVKVRLRLSLALSLFC